MAAEQQRSRGAQLMAEGEKALKKFSFFNKNQKYEDAKELFQQAGNCFKAARAWAEAGEAYAKALDCHVKLGETFDAATYAQEAANCYKNVNPEDAVSYLRQAVGYLTEMGKFKMVGKIYKEMAEIYEKEGNLDEAIENYSQASEYFTTEGNKASANECNQKVASLLTMPRGDAEPSLENYARAAKIYEDMGIAALENRLLQYNAKNHFMNCVLIYFAMGDQVAVGQKLEQFKHADYTFGESRECKFLDKILKAWQDGNSDEFTDHCAEYNSISPLDPWRTSMLVRCKRAIQSESAAHEDVDIM